MAEPGWYPDPQDPASEAYYDGTVWTGARRPLNTSPPWQPPAPSWGSPTAWQPEWQPPLPPARRRRRWPFVVAIVAVAAVAGGVLTWQFWPSSKEKITYGGKPIADPAAVLTKAEAELHSYVKSRHGVTNTATRCYFSRATTPAEGTPDSDVSRSLSCGPVLFVDGDPARPYVTIALSAGGRSGESVTLTPPQTLHDLEQKALGTDVKLIRPDGQTPPNGAGGLTVPEPPPAERDVLTVAELGPTDTPDTLDNALMVGKNVGVRLDAAGKIPRYGQGDDARSAPAGEALLAFQISYVAGDVGGAGATRARVVVNHGKPRTVPATVGGDEWDILALPDSGSAVLELREGGFTQTLSLPDGKPGSDNLAVLTRTSRVVALHRSASIPVRFSNGVGSASDTWQARMSEARLEFWDHFYDSVHASDGRHALLSTDLDYKDTYNGNFYGFDPSQLRLILPGGQVVHARNIARHHRVKNVFEVPASFTHGTLKITGSAVIRDITVTIQRTVTFRISF